MAASFLETPPSPTSSLRLFCLAYAGGKASAFAGWKNRLPQHIELCPIELPGHGRRFKESPFRRIDPLVNALYAELRPHLDRPYALFGYSMGATIALRIARRATESGMGPRALFTGGAAPRPRRKKIRHTMSRTDFIRELRLLGGSPAHLFDEPELLDLLLPVVQADFEVLETCTYAPAPVLQCPIFVFGGREDPEVNEEELADWAVETSSPFTLRMHAGDHFFLAQHEAWLVDHIGRALES
jgi:medium-chain acyl-[acyl-carrier-protein] hydrolase